MHLELKAMSSHDISAIYALSQRPVSVPIISNHRSSEKSTSGINAKYLMKYSRTGRRIFLHKDVLPSTATQIGSRHSELVAKASLFRVCYVNTEPCIIGDLWHSMSRIDQSQNSAFQPHVLNFYYAVLDTEENRVGSAK